MERKYLLTLLIVSALLFAGCVGGPSDQQATTGDTGGTSGDWCDEGASWTQTDPETGEVVSMEINGITEYEGRRVCEAEWSSNGERMVFYFTEGEEYAKIVKYEDGEVIEEIEMSGGEGEGSTADGDSDGSSASDGTDDSDVARSEWCPEGQTTSFSGPRGTRQTLTIQGVEERDGRQVCKGTYETNEPEGENDIVRFVYYYSEDEEYQRFESYDTNDVLRTEMTITEDSLTVVEYDENGNEVNRVERNTGGS